jgi:hypothetical protein
MSTGHNFQHLPLLHRESGPANIPGGGASSPQTAENKANRTTHSNTLIAGATTVVNERRSVENERESESLPELPAGISLLLEVDTEIDVDDLRHHFDFEIVSEEEDGFVIVASNDVDLGDFLDAVTRFASTNIRQQRGTATIAAIHRLDDDADQRKRLELILSQHLHESWPNLDGVETCCVDVGVACVGIETLAQGRKSLSEEIPNLMKRGPGAKAVGHRGRMNGSRRELVLTMHGTS